MRATRQARPSVVRIVPALAALSLAGCAATVSHSNDRAVPRSAGDPLESVNRSVFAVNQRIDAHLLKPIAQAYDSGAPDAAQNGLSNVLANLREPYSFVNDVLQARPCQAAGAGARFLVNSTVGIGGLVDVARTEFALSHHDNDFGLTLANWGVPAGPYVVLPLLGPSNARDAAGFALEWVAEPMDVAFSAVGIGYVSYVRTGLDVLDHRADMLSDTDHLDAAALDRYATYRTAYQQSRLAQARRPPCRLSGRAKAERRTPPD